MDRSVLSRRFPPLFLFIRFVPRSVLRTSFFVTRLFSSSLFFLYRWRSVAFFPVKISFQSVRLYVLSYFITLFRSVSSSESFQLNVPFKFLFKFFLLLKFRSAFLFSIILFSALLRLVVSTEYLFEFCFLTSFLSCNALGF
jgi:hypothetical protein